MNKEIIRKSGEYDLLVKLTGKKKKAIKQYFWRNGKTIEDIDFVKEYLFNNIKYETNNRTN